MKKKIRVKTVITVMLLALAAAGGTGCGGQRTKEPESGMDAAGESVKNKTSHATDEMELENESAQQEAADGGKTGARDDGAGAGKDAQQTVVDPSELTEPEILPKDTEELPPGQPDGGQLQIVFLGDSILDGYRGATGIDYLTGINCKAEVYNLAMGGTTAALTTYEKAEYENWNSRSLQGVVHAICGEIGPGILDGYKAGEVFAACDFKKTDYFVIEYGMNDFLSGIPLNDEESYYDEYTYVGALRVAVQRLREYYPDAAVVLCAPNYAQFFAGDGSWLGDGNTVNNGGGTLAEYYRVCGNVSEDMKTLFLDAYEGIGLNAYTAEEYLEDGIHLSEKGRKKYAEKLSEIILEYESVKNN